MSPLKSFVFRIRARLMSKTAALRKSAQTAAIVACVAVAVYFLPMVIRTPGFTDSFLPPAPVYQAGLHGMVCFERRGFGY